MIKATGSLGPQRLHGTEGTGPAIVPTTDKIQRAVIVLGLYDGGRLL